MLKRNALQMIAEDLLDHEKAVPPEKACPISSSAQPILGHPRHSPMQHLFRSMQYGSPDDTSLTRSQMTSNLQAFGEICLSAAQLACDAY